MRKLVCAALVFLGVTVAHAVPRPGVIVIDEDNGGRISTYLDFYRRIEASGVPIRVEGICISACTLVLALPPIQVCVTRTASFGFHQATINDKPAPRVTETLVRRYYPLSVQKWIKDHGPLVEDPIYMSGAEIIAAGVFPECKD